MLHVNDPVQDFYIYIQNKSNVTMKTPFYPPDESHVRFTDMQGVTRKGIFKKEANGYVELSEVEMPMETKFVFPVDEIVRWEKVEDDDIDLTKFIL